MAAKKADTEASIQAEIDAIQGDRVKLEDGVRKSLAEASAAHRRADDDAAATLRDGLTAIDVRHRNATQRLGALRADELKAELLASRGTPPPAAAADAKGVE